MLITTLKVAERSGVDMKYVWIYLLMKKASPAFRKARRGMLFLSPLDLLLRKLL